MIVSKWGNSLGIRIPHAVAVQAGIDLGAELRVSAVKGRIVLEPARLRLADLVAGISAHNRHESEQTGAVYGAEIW